MCMCEYSGYQCQDCEHAAAKASLAESRTAYVSANGRQPTTVHASYDVIEALGPLCGAGGAGVKNIAGLRVVFESDGTRLYVAGDE